MRVKDGKQSPISTVVLCNVMYERVVVVVVLFFKGF